MSQTDEDFAALFAESERKGSHSKKLSPGQSIEGTVVQITQDTVFVDVGTRSEGQIDRRQLCNAEGELQVAVGDRLRATVAKGGDRPRLVIGFGRGGGMDLEALELAQQSGAPVDGEVAKVIKGGLEIDVAGRRCFCPASQIDIGFIPDLAVYEGKILQFKVIEVKDNGRSVVVSRKALLADERRQKSQQLLAELRPGSVVDGTVQSIQSYGAFVDIGGIEGLIHISQLGHGRVSSVSDVVSVGEEVKVQVIDIEPGSDDKDPRVRLSMKTLDPDGAAAASSSRGPKMEILDAEVVKVEPFGVFVTTEKGPAVIPTRELVLAPGADPRRSYPVGKSVRAVSVGNDSSGRARLSERRVEEAEARLNFRAFREEQKKESRKGSSLGSFGDLLQAHLKN